MSAQPQTFAHSSEPLNPRRDLLRRCAVFAGLPDVALSEVALASQPTRLERKRARTGMLRGLFVVGAGRARLARTVGTRVVTLHYVGPGDVYGEGFLSDEADDLELLVLSDMDTLRVPLTVVQRLVDQEPSVARALLDVQNRRRRQLEARLTDFLTRTVEARVAAFIQQVAGRHGIPESRGVLVGEKFTHVEIAEFVGATRETVTLVLGVLKRDGIIDTDHRRLVVLDAEGLALRASATAGP
ncbi:MAG: Crp/Fnr family transcriptional regulator [Polyangiales bacterium]|nr:Crp/Fnr family transcriptional regulator [Sandaracinaceae bacterium]